uniref:Uncharacterized protein n=1 Tax=Romanomermis culicivorax TaxID=13658 RepID=A0A915KXZ5_ROMCU
MLPQWYQPQRTKKCAARTLFWPASHPQPGENFEGGNPQSHCDLVREKSTVIKKLANEVDLDECCILLDESSDLFRPKLTKTTTKAMKTSAAVTTQATTKNVEIVESEKTPFGNYKTTFSDKSFFNNSIIILTFTDR